MSGRHTAYYGRTHGALGNLKGMNFLNVAGAANGYVMTQRLCSHRALHLWENQFKGHVVMYLVIEDCRQSRNIF